MAWQKFLVPLKGEDAIEVQTNASDWASVVVDPTAAKALDMTFRVVHHALRRMGHDGTPRDYDGFLEVLDGMPETIGAEDADLLDPTHPDHSAESP